MSLELTPEEKTKLLNRMQSAAINVSSLRTYGELKTNVSDRLRKQEITATLQMVEAIICFFDYASDQSDCFMLVEHYLRHIHKEFHDMLQS